MRKQGSAIITVIGVTVVLAILALAFIGSRSEKAGISKMLSDEKKCESIAESVSDLVLSYLKKNANKHENTTNNKLYYLLRAPLKFNSASASDGENIKLDVSQVKPLDNLDDYVGYSSLLQPMLEDIGWKDKVTIETKCELSSAEFFTPAISEYKVTNITTAHYPAKGDSAKFLDSNPNSISFTNEGDSDWKPSDWTLKIKFPSSDETDNPEKDTHEKTSFDIHLSSSNQVYDVMSVLNDSRKSLSEAKDKLREAEADLAQAETDGESADRINELKTAVAQAEEEVNKAEANNEEVYKNYKDDIESLNTNQGFPVKVTLEIMRNSKDDMVFKFKAKLKSKLLDFIASALGIQTEYEAPGDFDPIDCQKLIDETNFFPTIERPIGMTGLKNAVIDGSPDYDFSTYVSDIKNRMNEVSAGLSDYDLNSDSFSTPTVVEKGGILKITTKVTYKATENKEITRTLGSEIPFKVSDVQPIAPEYSLFIANSKLISNDKDMLDGISLGEPIDLNNASTSTINTDASLAAGRFIVHNVPFEGDMPNYQAMGGDTGRVPGMIRVNKNYKGKGDSTTQLRSFIGCIEEPELTEMNQMFSPNYARGIENKFNTQISFFWAKKASDYANAKRFHEVEFPVLFEQADVNHKIEEPGIKGFIDVYRRGGFDIVMAPTLLYGKGHMEYPLGINPEGPIDSVYSRIRVSCKPNANVSSNGFTEVSEIYYSYEPVCTYSDGKRYDFDGSAMKTGGKYEAARYGMLNHEGYEENNPWNSNGDYQYMPANCYDAMQYAKKATRFYMNASEFIADMKKPIKSGGLKDPSGNVVLEGVYYIKEGDLELNATTFKGTGLIVVKNSIDINGNIKVADTNTVLGLIARLGLVTFGKGCSEVSAAIFSNNPPMSESSKLSIYGNLVTNAFIREYLLDVEVYYDNRICSVSPLATLRKAGKFEPRRYCVAFADNWSKFAYEKTK